MENKILTIARVIWLLILLVGVGFLTYSAFVTVWWLGIIFLSVISLGIYIGFKYD